MSLLIRSGVRQYPAVGRTCSDRLQRPQAGQRQSLGGPGGEAPEALEDLSIFKYLQILKMPLLCTLKPVYSIRFEINRTSSVGEEKQFIILSFCKTLLLHHNVSFFPCWSLKCSQSGWSLDWHRHVSNTITSSIQFCDTTICSNVSDLILQCTSSHVDFQALQFYAINCSMSSILH